MRRYSFEDIIEDVSAGNTKIQKGDYLPSGTYPIIDQGQEFIGGFSNDPADLVRDDGPWIVFGDHTRALKFVEKPFCMGADGVKVLKLKRDRLSDLKYVFRFLQFANIPSAGYSRHYKFLKRLEIALPPLDEQKRIAAILDKADALRRQRRQALALLDSLTQSIFLEMFGDPVSNPMGWPAGRVGDLLESVAYGTSGKAGPAGAFPILRMGNVTSNGMIDVSNLKYIDLNEIDIRKYTVNRGDILFNRTNSSELVGKTAVFDLDQTFAFAGYLVRARSSSRSTPEYISCYLNSRYGKSILKGMAKSIVGMANINAREMQGIPIPVPPVEIQRKFSERLALIKEERLHYLMPLEKSDSLFASLQHRAFSGQL